MTPVERDVAQLRTALAEAQRLNADLKATIREIQEAVKAMAWARVEEPDADQPLRLHLEH
jgi:hypothetical protein